MISRRGRVNSCVIYNRFTSVFQEPDCILGIATVRPGLVVSSSNQDDEISTMWERIVEYESSGDWSDAMACYEHLLDKVIARKDEEENSNNNQFFGSREEVKILLIFMLVFFLSFE